MGKKRRIKKNQNKQGHDPVSHDNPRNTSRDSDINSLGDDVFHQIIPSLLNIWKQQVNITRSSVNNTMDRNDFISGLPNDILYQIISLLPFESAVRTTLLSTHWKDLWKEALLDTVRDATMEAATADILSFLDGFDEHHRPRNKWGFRFELNHGRAILVAISSRGALQLDFSAAKQEYPRPFDNFDLLLNLNLAFPNRSSFRSTFAWFLEEDHAKEVKSLYLISVSYPYSEAVSSLVPKLTFLRSLTIAKCNALRSLEIKEARRLHKLVVLDCPQLESLSFEGSCLKSFRYRGNSVSFRFNVSCECDLYLGFPYDCHSGLCLEDAMLDLRQGPLTHWTWDFEKPSRYRSYYDVFRESKLCGCATKSKCFKSILQSINGVKSLTLCRWFYETTMCKKLRFSSRDPEFCFSQLRELWWIDCSMERDKIDALLCFLKLCPKLERLYVTIDPKCYNFRSTEKFSAIDSTPEVLKHLKVVKLEGFADEQKEIFMARQLIPLFLGDPVVISKSVGTCLKQLVKVAKLKLKKKGKHPYKFEVVENVLFFAKLVENVNEICPDHVHMKL